MFTPSEEDGDLPESHGGCCRGQRTYVISVAILLAALAAIIIGFALGPNVGGDNGGSADSAAQQGGGKGLEKDGNEVELGGNEANFVEVVEVASYVQKLGLEVDRIFDGNEADAFEAVMEMVAVEADEGGSELSLIQSECTLLRSTRPRSQPKSVSDPVSHLSLMLASEASVFRIEVEFKMEFYYIAPLNGDGSYADVFEQKVNGGLPHLVQKLREEGGLPIQTAGPVTREGDEATTAKTAAPFPAGNVQPTPGPNLQPSPGPNSMPPSPRPSSQPTTQRPNSKGPWWKPKSSDRLTWQWQLLGSIDTSFDVDMYDIDLFDNSAEFIANLRAQGRIVVCYFSAGTYEGWRDDWREHFPFITGTNYVGNRAPFANKMSEWDERWLDIRRIDLLGDIMRGRLQLAKAKGCDAVEPDNVDAYDNGDETGLDLTAEDQKRYNLWLAEEAHKIGISIGLKNDVGQLEELVDAFDWAINEQCFEFDECDEYSAFTSRDKAVFGVEYSGKPSVFCPVANKMGLSWLKKRLNLNVFRIGCEDYLR